jgi:hypothetical protein
MPRIFRLLIGGLLFGFYLVNNNALAATPKSPQGITVSPAFQQVSIYASESEHPVNFSITNNKPTAQTLSFSAADFSTLNDSGGLFFVGTNPTALQNKYGLAKWLNLSEKTITIQPKQTISVQANILNLPDLAAGGHYGALMISLAPTQTSSSGKTSVSIHPLASALLFVTKVGGDTHKLSLQGVTINRKLFSMPDSIYLSFKNDGNTHLIPRGIATIKNPHGKIINKAIINDDSGIILPETMRRYYVPLQQISASNSFGKYTLQVDFRFDGINQFRSYQQSFTYFPLSTFLLLVMLLIAIGFLTRRFRLIEKLRLVLKKYIK